MRRARDNIAPRAPKLQGVVKGRSLLRDLAKYLTVLLKYPTTLATHFQG